MQRIQRMQRDVTKSVEIGKHNHNLCVNERYDWSDMCYTEYYNYIALVVEVFCKIKTFFKIVLGL